MAQSMKLIAASALIALVVLIIWINYRVNKYFEQHLNGFWIHDAMDGKYILYIDTETNTMRIISILDNANPINEKLLVSFSSQTYLDMYMRRYHITGVESELTGTYSKEFSGSDLYLDMYPTEGAIILNDSDGDILTFVKDHSLSLELLM